MSRTAPFTSTSALVLAALCLGAVAWAAPPAPAPAPVSVVVAYVPGAAVDVDAALLRGLRRGLEAGGARLVVGRRAAQWSNAAPETVRLVTAEHARALVTPPERRVAHLMAQVATRTQVPVVATCSAPTVGATGSTWVIPAAKEEPADLAGWEALGVRAAALALERLAR